VTAVRFFKTYFRAVPNQLTMLLTLSGYRPHLKPQTSDFVLILGLDWCGSTIQSKLVPRSSLVDNSLTRSFFQEWISKCCWYEVIGGARPIHKLKSRGDAIKKSVSNLRLEPQSTSVLAEIQAFNEELREVESYCAYLQASPVIF
jgi:hypothetical protein